MVDDQQHNITATSGRHGRAIMLQGTGSDVGKSTLVAGLCRLFQRRGLRVVPFKPQNMSNNAAVTVDGGEIGRAQALQAMACRIPSRVDMNPVLLKPENDTSVQVIVHGKVAGKLGAAEFGKRGSLLPAVMESFNRLRSDADLVIIEGAGSAAEVNLRVGDIANMGFATAAQVPVILVGDIDRGGVIASLVGTHAVLEPSDLALVRGFLINKFRGDVGLFKAGERFIEERTGWKSFGIVPWLSGCAHLPAEDAVVLQRSQSEDQTRDRFVIVVPMLSRISNFDDLDPLAAEPGVEVQMIPPGKPLPLDADLIVLPGTKSTIADLQFFRTQGWDVDLHAHVRRGGAVLGLCGGYQMLGTIVCDPHGVEGAAGSEPGFGLLNVQTTLSRDKTVRRVHGRHLPSDQTLEGYEIHAGVTQGPDTQRPWVQLWTAEEETQRWNDGAQSANGRIAGGYVHGVFQSGSFRQAILRSLGHAGGQGKNHDDLIHMALDEIADGLTACVDVEAVLAAAS
jgi:adenosylcobyric acid synthase